jgi:hypothetical protein
LDIPNNVESIGDNAFEECSNLASLHIGNGVTSIGKNAFDGTAWFNNQKDGIVYAGKVAYCYKGKMPANTTIILESGTLAIAEEAFYGFDNLTSVDIPNSVTSIGNNAFEKTSWYINQPGGLVYAGKVAYKYKGEMPTNTDIVLEDGTLAIADGAFQVLDDEGLIVGQVGDFDDSDHYCLTSVTIPNSVTSIGNDAFLGCRGLTSVTIPNSVTSIGENAFQGCSGLTSVTIPNSVTSIGENVFRDCSGLTSVTLLCPYTVPSSTFAGCLNIQEVTYNCWAVTPIFSGLSSIERVTMKEDVKEILKVAFKNCKNLTTVNIGSSVIFIRESAFEGCSGLTSVTIPNSVTSIGRYAFADCSGLTSVTVQGNPTLIGSNLFEGCPIKEVIFDCEKVTPLFKGSSIKTVTMKESVKSIGDNAFRGCRGLTSLDIPNNVESIGDNAFEECSNLASIHIGNGVTSIGNNAFANCSSLTSVTVHGSPTTIGSGLFDSCPITEVIFDCETVTHLFSGYTSIETLTIKEGVTAIGENAFRGCLGLTSLTVPNNVTSIGYSAFEECSSLTFIALGNSVTSIGKNAFASCSGLTTLTIPNSVTSIEGKAFQNCSGLTSLTIGNNVEYIGNDAFSDCRGLTSLTIPNSVTFIGEKAFWDCSGLTSLTIGNNVGYIGDYAFSGCSQLESLTIPNSVSWIGHYAFENCSNLYLVTVLCSPTDVGYKVFVGCSSGMDVTFDCETVTPLFKGASIKTLTMKESVKSIGKNAFRDCSGLTSVTIPNSVTSIGDQAFSGCSDLTSVSLLCSPTTLGSSIFKDSNGIKEVTLDCETVTSLFSGKETIKSVTMKEGVKSIGDGAFLRCIGLTTLTIGNNVTSIGSNAFEGCSNLASLTIPNSVTSIGSNAFEGSAWYKKQPDGLVYAGKVAYNYKGDMPVNTSISLESGTLGIADYAFFLCSNLTSLTIPSTVTLIGDYAFCTALNVITCKGDTPPTCKSQALEGVDKSVCKLYVPKGHKADYQAAEHWKEFLFVEEGDYVITNEYTLTYTVDGEVYKTTKVAEGDAITPEPAPTKDGYTFSGWSTIPATMPAEDVTITGKFTKDAIPSNVEPITIGKSGKASYCGDQSLDFSGSEEIKAYIATGFDKDAEIIWLTRVKDVPAGTPVLIKGEANQTYQVPVTDTKNSYYKNMFKGNTSGATIQVNETDGDMVNYYLSGDGTFKSVKGYANIGNNKSYLQLPGTFAPAEAGATQTVKVGSSGKASYAAPVDLDFTNVEGLKAFTATGYDKSSKTIWLTRVMKVQKGEGVLLKGDAKDYEIPSVAVQSSYMNMFVGNTSGAQTQVQATSADGSKTNFYLKGDGTFVSVNGYVNIGNNKCYLALPTDMVATAATTRGEASYLLEEPEMIKMPILFRSLDSNGNGTTGLKEVKSGAAKSEEWFTLQGQRVLNPGKGLYIKNGRKVVIK